MKVRWIYVVFVIEFIISIYILYLFDLLERMLYGGVELIIGILGALIGGKLLYNLTINKKNISVHSQDLVNTVFKEWLKDTRLLKHSEKRQQAIEHLRKGYPNVCNLLIEHERLRRIYSESYINTRDYINIKLVEKVPMQFVDYSSGRQPPATYYNLSTTIDYIHKESEHFLKYGDLIGNEIKCVCHGKWKVYSFWGEIARSDKESIEVFRKVLEVIITDKHLLELVKLCGLSKKEFDTNTNIVNQELSIIIDDVIDGHQPLNNTCYRCEKWHKVFI